ncbi:hypothetical protein D3C72_2274510 [compost metagenome]
MMGNGIGWISAPLKAAHAVSSTCGTRSPPSRASRATTSSSTTELTVSRISACTDTRVSSVTSAALP